MQYLTWHNIGKFMVVTQYLQYTTGANPLIQVVLVAACIALVKAWHAHLNAHGETKGIWTMEEYQATLDTIKPLIDVQPTKTDMPTKAL